MTQYFYLNEIEEKNAVKNFVFLFFINMYILNMKIITNRYMYYIWWWIILYICYIYMYILYVLYYTWKQKITHKKLKNDYRYKPSKKWTLSILKAMKYKEQQKSCPSYLSVSVRYLMVASNLLASFIWFDFFIWFYFFDHTTEFCLIRADLKYCDKYAWLNLRGSSFFKWFGQ